MTFGETKFRVWSFETRYHENSQLLEDPARNANDELETRNSKLETLPRPRPRAWPNRRHLDQCREHHRHRDFPEGARDDLQCRHARPRDIRLDCRRTIGAGRRSYLRRADHAAAARGRRI